MIIVSFILNIESRRFKEVRISESEHLFGGIFNYSYSCFFFLIFLGLNHRHLHISIFWDLLFRFLHFRGFLFWKQQQLRLCVDHRQIVFWVRKSILHYAILRGFSIYKVISKTIHYQQLLMSLVSKRAKCLLDALQRSI